MSSNTPIRILLGIPHGWLRETISQTLAHNGELLIAHTRHDLMVQALRKPDAVIAEPFAFGEPGLDLLRELKAHAPAVPLIVLLPFDTRDYRDAAMRTGANGVIIVEDVTTDLSPIINEAIKRATLVNGITNEIAQIAERGAPLGEAAYHDDLARLSDRAVEQLAPTMPPLATQDFSPRADPIEPQTFLRGLALTSKTISTAAPARTVRTACNLNCGSHFCGLNVTVRDQRVVKIEPADFPDERYRRICLKGISYTQMLAHPRRVLHPLKRVGARGSDQWERVSWDHAIDEITAQMRAIQTRYGNASMMFFPYSGQLGTLNSMNGVYARLASALGASASSSATYGMDSAVPSGIEDTLGSGTGYSANDFADLPNSKTILIWGGDPAQSRMNWWNFFIEAKRAGARLITIDPRFSITASKSDAWIPIRPGTDLYLALALARLIVEQNWLNRDFVLHHTVAPLLALDYGWLWGSGDTTPVTIRVADATITLPAGKFALEFLPDRPAWLYMIEGVASVRSACGDATVRGGEMLMLANSARAVLLDAFVIAALHPTDRSPIAPSWEPTLEARARDQLAQMGINVAQVTTFVTYFVIILVLGLTPLVAIIWWWRRR